MKSIKLYQAVGGTFPLIHQSRPIQYSIQLSSPTLKSYVPPRHWSALLFKSTSRRHNSTSTNPSSPIIRPLIPPPEEGSGPLLSRRSDRALPTLKNPRLWLKTMPIFILVITLSSLAIFNYQKSSSSTVNSILYALRTNEHARALLGDEVYFANKIPWIWGELNQLHGSINISFWVKGTKAQGLVKFVSIRKRRDGFFETLEWSLKMEDGTEVQLLDLEGVKDPIKQQ